MFLSASLIYFIEGIKLRFIRNPEAGTPTIFTGPKEEPRDDNDYNPQLTKKGDLITFTLIVLILCFFNEWWPESTQLPPKLPSSFILTRS